MAFQPHTFMFQSPHEDNDRLPSPTSLNSLPSCPPQFFHGAPFMMKRSMSFSGIDKCEEAHGDEELSDDGSHLGEKKKRLNLDQVKALEKSFELGNKLEPDRKIQLARALGLQPRQVAIWFQNRRARWKTKQLERDYEVLKKQFEALKADNDGLQAHNKKLHSELVALKSKDSNGVNDLKKETDQGSWSNGSTENSSDVNLDMMMSRAAVISSPAVSSHLSSKQLFPTAIRPTTSMTQLVQASSRPDLRMVQEETFCNMFNGMDQEQQTGFWQWPEHQNFH